MVFEILIVDDEQDICQLIGDTLKDEGYKTRLAHDGQSAIDSIRQSRPSLVILDIWLGDSRFDGIRVLEEALQLHPDLPVIMMSGHGTIETAVETIRKGAYDFVEKPFKMDRLLVAVKRAQEAFHLKLENALLKEQSDFHQGDFSESVMPEQIMSSLRRSAASESRIMIGGEPGCGKSYAARLIHQLSPRSKGGFVHLNCASFDDASFEELIFGTESEEEISLGAFEKAQHGILFLDQVDQLSLENQKSLFELLHKKSFKRLGGQSNVTVDVRLISSVSPQIQDKLDQGLFIKELYLRLCMTMLKMPALRERPMEMNKLIKTFSEASAKAHSLPVKTFSKEAFFALQTHSWPGNLKQLKNVIDWFYVVKKEVELITLDHLPADFAGETPSLSLHTNQMSHLISLPLKEARMEFERDYLKAQVSRFSGNISSTATFVGMERSALHRKLKNLKIGKAS